MDLMANGPAVLGGMMLTVAMLAWAMGRWQGGFSAAEDARKAGEREAPHGAMQEMPQGPEAVHDAPRMQRRSALAASDSLGDLHEEISAYRRAQQVLASAEGDGLGINTLAGDARSECRHLGVMGQPTCAAAEPVRAACACGTRCGLADPRPPVRTERLVQPVAAAPGLTRV